MSTEIFYLVIIAALFHALWNFLAKKTKGDKIYVLWLSHFYIGIFILPVALFFAPIDFHDLTWLKFLILTSVVHGLYIFLLGWSYSLGDITTIYPVARGSSVAETAFIATFLAVDNISLTGYFGILLITIGTLSIGFHETSKRKYQKGFVAALFVGACIAVYSLIDKMGVQNTEPYFYVAGMNLLTALFMAPFILKKYQNNILSYTKKCSASALLIAACSFSTYYVILYAFKYSQVSYVVALREVSIIIASLLGFYFLKESVTLRKVIGIIIIFLGAACIRLA